MVRQEMEARMDDYAEHSQAFVLDLLTRLERGEPVGREEITRALAEATYVMEAILAASNKNE